MSKRSVYWLFEGREIRTSDVKMVGPSSILLFQVRKNNEGVYECAGTDFDGNQFNAMATIHVRGDLQLILKSFGLLSLV